MQFPTSTIAAAALMAVCVVSAAPAQARPSQKSQDELKRSYEAKLKESWFVDGGWTDDYDLARKRAAAQGKYIFAYFTRTYAP